MVLKNGHAYLLDSLNNEIINKAITNKAKNVLKIFSELYKIQYKMSNYPYIIPKQENGYDCGVFVCGFLRSLCHNILDLKFDPNQVRQQIRPVKNFEKFPIKPSQNKTSTAASRKLADKANTGKTITNHVTENNYYKIKTPMSESGYTETINPVHAYPKKNVVVRKAADKAITNAITNPVTEIKYHRIKTPMSESGCTETIKPVQANIQKNSIPKKITKIIKIIKSDTLKYISKTNLFKIIDLMVEQKISLEDRVMILERLNLNDNFVTQYDQAMNNIKAVINKNIRKVVIKNDHVKITIINSLFQAEVPPLITNHNNQHLIKYVPLIKSPIKKPWEGEMVSAPVIIDPPSPKFEDCSRMTDQIIYRTLQKMDKQIHKNEISDDDSNAVAFQEEKLNNEHIIPEDVDLIENVSINKQLNVILSDNGMEAEKATCSTDLFQTQINTQMLEDPMDFIYSDSATNFQLEPVSSKSAVMSMELTPASRDTIKATNNKRKQSTSPSSSQASQYSLFEPHVERLFHGKFSDALW